MVYGLGLSIQSGISAGAYRVKNPMNGGPRSSHQTAKKIPSVLFRPSH